MIELLCPHCKHQLRIADEFAGKIGRCKHCRTKFAVPEPDPDAPAPQEPAAEQPPMQNFALDADDPATSAVPGTGAEAVGMSFEDLMEDTGSAGADDPATAAAPGIGAGVAPMSVEDLMGDTGLGGVDPLGLDAPPASASRATPLTENAAPHVIYEDSQRRQQQDPECHVEDAV